MEYQEDYDSGEDSDIIEVAIIAPKRVGPSSSTPRCSSPAPKRRKSSPQMDPIPTYAPLSSDLLENQRAINSNSLASSSYYTATNESRNHNDDSNNDNNNHYLSSLSNSASPISATKNRTERSSRRSRLYDEYVPLSGPDPIIEAYSCNMSPPRDYQPTTRLQHATLTSITTVETTTKSKAKTKNSQTRARTRSGNNPQAPRPVSTALARAVAQQRNLQQSQRASLTISGTTRSVATFCESRTASSNYAEKPMMWSPKLPSQIEPVKDEEAERAKKMLEDEQKLKNGEYQLPRATKTRVAHKPPPTVARNKQNRPKLPVGTAKKVPQNFRVKYLNVIIDEYLNTGHKEELAYEQALKDEQSLAARAANKNIYANLVAGLKKKIRESAGISKPPDDDPKYINGNKVVSHEEILTGKVIGTISIQRKRKVSDPAELDEHQLYDRLQRYIIPTDSLEDYGYPSRDPDNLELRKVPLSKNGQKQQLRNILADSYTCDRCMRVYRVDEVGMQLDTTGKCIYHAGHLWNERINRATEKRYSCCKGDSSSGGCSTNPYHVHRGDLELKNYQGYVETKPKLELEPNRHGIYALDCEMCYTTYGLELTRVTVINYKHDVVYEELVRPSNPILDYNTKFSGIKEGDLDAVTKTLADVQDDLLQMFSNKTILVGHSLDSDMKALRIFHKRFIDTAQLFPHKRGLPFKRALRTLMIENLRVIIQEDSGHDSKEDAIAAFRLVMWKAKTDVPEKSS